MTLRRRQKRRVVFFGATFLISIAIFTLWDYEWDGPLSLGDRNARALARVDQSVLGGGERLRYCASINGTRKCGKPFSARWIPYLVDLGLSDTQTSQLTNTQDRALLRRPTPLALHSAFSDNHFGDAARSLLRTTAKVFPGRQITVLDLGLSEGNKRKLREFNGLQISVEEFPFHKYPAYVRKLTQYRWKPLALAAALQKHGGVLHADAHVEWSTGNLSGLRDRLAHGVFAQTLLWPTGHSIKATTHPRLYEYLPVEEAGAAATEMGCAGFQHIIATGDVLRNVVKWAVLCALEEDCMAPGGMTDIACKLPDGPARFTDYAGCHRYDQSVFNILLANRHAFDRSAYYHEVDVPRRHRPSAGEFRPTPFVPRPLDL